MFFNCTSLLYLPNIYKWNKRNIKNMNNIIDNCKLIREIQDISKWNDEILIISIILLIGLNYYFL